jgi:hypothetical protein
MLSMMWFTAIGISGIQLHPKKTIAIASIPAQSTSSVVVTVLSSQRTPDRHDSTQSSKRK